MSTVAIIKMKNNVQYLSFYFFHPPKHLNIWRVCDIISVMRRLKEIRLRKKIRLTDAADALGVSQPTLSGWESDRKSPTSKMLVKIAEYYGVTTDYLLGRDIELHSDHTVPIPVEILCTLDSKPVWVPERGWALVNAADNCLLFADGSSIPFTEAKTQQLRPEMFAESPIPTTSPIPFKALSSYGTVWVEPTGKDSELRQALRGRYSIRSGYAENDCGSKFGFCSYGATWLAFEIKE